MVSGPLKGFSGDSKEKNKRNSSNTLYQRFRRLFDGSDFYQAAYLLVFFFFLSFTIHHKGYNLCGRNRSGKRT